MSVIATAVRHLMAAGVTGDALLAAIAELEAELCAAPKPQSKGAIRTQRWRENKKAEASQSVTCDESDGGDAPSEVPPNDIYSNPPPTSPSGANAPSPSLAEKVVEAWNEGPGAAGATTAKPLNADRRKALSLRVRENGEEAVFDAIRNLGRSDWHCGKSDRGWKANLGWLLKSPENFQKALEMEPTGTAAPANNNLASLAAQAARYRRPPMTTPSPRGETREARA